MTKLFREVRVNPHNPGEQFAPVLISELLNLDKQPSSKTYVFLNYKNIFPA